MTRRKSHIEKILALLERGNLTVELLPAHYFQKSIWGYCHIDDREIEIKRTLCINNQIFMLIHECLHLINPKEHENWVRARTPEVYNALTKLQRKKLEAFLRGVR